MDYSVLGDIVILLAASVVAVAGFRQLNLPPILAYLCVGILVGPNGLAWIAESEDTRILAEFGIVFLLFTVGLQISLPQLISMRKEVLGLGAAQVSVTTVVTSAIAWMLGMPLDIAFVLGGVFAMSSTAVVTKQLTEQMELSSRHGRLSLGILLFQDLAVVPFLILIPILIGPTERSFVAGLLLAILEGAFVIVLMLAIGRWLLRPLFHHVASYRSAELFTLTALLLTLAAAWATHQKGLSLALGAFLAGVMLGETEFKHQVEADIRPFRDVLLGLFFVTIGMFLDVHLLPSIFPSVLLLLLALIVFKIVSIMALSIGMGAPPGVALRTGIVLAQGGEFGLALLLLAMDVRFIEGEWVQVVLAAIVLSMVLTPVLIRHNGTIAKLVFRKSYLDNRRSIINDVALSAQHLSDHIVICGYGRNGQNIARFLEREGFVYTALDLDPVRVREARAGGENIRYGDATRREILEAAGVERAKAVVVSCDDVGSAIKICKCVRILRPDLPILVRTYDETSLDSLQEAGATDVVPESLEASLMLASQLLYLLDVPVARIVGHVQDVRGDQYKMLRGYFHGQETQPLADTIAARERLHTVSLTSGAHAVGRTLDELKLKDSGVVVTAVRRSGIRGQHPEPDMRLQAGDNLVLYGTPEDLAHAEAVLLEG